MAREDDAEGDSGAIPATNSPAPPVEVEESDPGPPVDAEPALENDDIGQSVDAQGRVYEIPRPEKVKRRFAFIDTNILVHYPAPKSLPWTKLLDADEVVLVVSPLILSELQQLKEHQRHDRDGRRADKMINWLEPFSNPPAPTMENPLALSDTLFLAFDSRAVPADIVKRDFLDRTLNDDRILGGILAARRRLGPEKGSVCLVSADAGARLRARSRSVDAYDLPGLRLPPAPNPDTEELAMYRAVPKPVLALSFPDGKTWRAIELPALHADVDELASRELQGLAEDLFGPSFPWQHNGGLDGLLVRARSMPGQFSIGSERPATEYLLHAQTEIPNIIRDRNTRARIVPVRDLRLENAGSKGAVKIRLVASFPPGVKFVGVIRQPRHLPPMPHTSAMERAGIVRRQAAGSKPRANQWTHLEGGRAVIEHPFLHYGESWAVPTLFVQLEESRNDAPLFISFALGADNLHPPKSAKIRVNIQRNQAPIPLSLRNEETHVWGDED